MVFSMFTKLYNHQHSHVSEHIHHLKNRCPFKGQRCYSEASLYNSLGQFARQPQA